MSRTLNDPLRCSDTFLIWDKWSVELPQPRVYTTYVLTPRNGSRKRKIIQWCGKYKGNGLLMRIVLSVTKLPHNMEFSSWNSNNYVAASYVILQICKAPIGIFTRNWWKYVAKILRNLKNGRSRCTFSWKTTHNTRQKCTQCVCVCVCSECVCLSVCLSVCVCAYLQPVCLCKNARRSSRHVSQTKRLRCHKPTV